MLKSISFPFDLVFWSEHDVGSSDFIYEDPLALDYLAQQVGNWLFPHFTTRTSRAQNYLVVAYGLMLADDAIKKYDYPGDDKTRIKLFERWEKFWALACMEHHNGDIKPGHKDSMRGIMGAIKNWKQSGQLSLDFELISRQRDLGSLGAYISSLRAYGLVKRGGYTVTHTAEDILRGFWRSNSTICHEYALKMIQLNNNKVSRLYKNIQLAKLGKYSCLSSISTRKNLQDKLWEILFDNAPDTSTLPLAKAITMASRDSNFKDKDTEKILTGILSGRWGKLDEENTNLVRLAVSFGHLRCNLLDTFNNAYASINEHQVNFNDVASNVFSGKQYEKLKKACGKFLSDADTGLHKFKSLQFHGPGFIKLIKEISNGSEAACLRSILKYHKQVQEVRNGSTWLELEQGNIVKLNLTSIDYDTQTSFHNFKLSSVRRLLTDLGRLNED